jgi:hypothetical protein
MCSLGGWIVEKNLLEATTSPNSQIRAICDVMASNEHAGLLEGRESLYPKLRQYLRSIYMGWITESEKFTPPELIPQRWAHERLSGWKKELEFSTSHDIKGYPKMQERFRWRSS